MPDHIIASDTDSLPRDAGDALRALPQLTPPRDAWAELKTRLPTPVAPSPVARHWLWLAAAATLALAFGLARWLAPIPSERPDAASESVATSPPALSELALLQAESAQLEALLDWQQGDAVESGAAASLGVAMQSRIEQIDALLARRDLSAEAHLPLWQERVLRLRQLTGLDNTQQWLAARGDADPGVPVLAF
jgi:hypothetical protein